MTTIQLRRGTASSAASDNPILADGEPGWDKTNGILKIGDGTTHWNDLPAILSGVFAPVAEPVALTKRPRPAFAAATTATTATLSAGTFEQVDASGGSKTRKIAAGVTAGDQITVKITAINSPATNTVTVQGDTGVTAPTIILTAINQAVTLDWSGSAWLISGRDNPTAYLDGRFTQLTGMVVNAQQVFGLVGDGGVADQTTAVRAAFACAAAGSHVILPAGQVKFTDTVTLGPTWGGKLTGMTEGDAGGTKLLFSPSDMTKPAFDCSSTSGLSGIDLENVQIVSSNTAGTASGVEGSGDCFQLYGLTNNSRFKNVYIHNFPGDAFNIKKKTTGTDLTACGNVVFDQVFVISCGGYAYRIDGYINAVWIMPDINSCVGGAFYFKNGVSNQANATIIGLWWEGSRSWSSLQPVLLEAMSGQGITFIAPNFQCSPAGGTDAIKVTGASSALVTLLGACGYGWTNWINDVSTGSTVGTIAYQSRITWLGTGSMTTSMKVRSTSPTFDLVNLSGSANQQDFRWAFAAGALALQLRNDDGTLASTLMSLSPAGAVTFIGGLTAPSVIAQGAGAILDFYDTAGGTVNQRRGRWGISGNQLALFARNDDGSNNKSVLLANCSTGLVEITNGAKLDKHLIKARTAQTLASNGALTIDTSATAYAEVTLQANATSMVFSGNQGAGHEITVTMIQDGSGGRTYAWPNTAKFAGGAGPSDTTASKRTSVTFLHDGTNWNEVSRAVAVG